MTPWTDFILILSPLTFGSFFLLLLLSPKGSSVSGKRLFFPPQLAPFNQICLKLSNNTV